jgi:hypothetical protein
MAMPDHIGEDDDDETIPPHYNDTGEFESLGDEDLDEDFE